LLAGNWLSGFVEEAAFRRVVLGLVGVSGLATLVAAALR
jgi:hypothetical protein